MTVLRMVIKIMLQNCTLFIIKECISTQQCMARLWNKSTKIHITKVSNGRIRNM